MTEEILKRLDALAAKLGVAAGHVYEVLTRQAIVEARTHLVWSAVFWILFAVMLRVAFGCWGKHVAATKSPDADSYRYQYRDGWLFGVFIPGTLAIVLLFAGVAHLVNAIQLLSNPEYFALQRIAEIFK